MNNFLLLLIIIILNIEFILAQHIISADPFKILEIEKNCLTDSSNFSTLIIRPIFNNKKTNKWSSSIRTEFYFNSNSPNYENMGNKFIGKGIGAFTSISLSYVSKNISGGILYMN